MFYSNHRDMTDIFLSTSYVYTCNCTRRIHSNQMDHVQSDHFENNKIFFRIRLAQLTISRFEHNFVSDFRRCTLHKEVSLQQQIENTVP